MAGVESISHSLMNEVEPRILLLRSCRVIIDADLAKLYGVTTKRLNEQVKRNKGRFPDDFAFRLTVKEKAELVANCDEFPICPIDSTCCEVEVANCDLKLLNSAVVS